MWVIVLLVIVLWILPEIWGAFVAHAVLSVMMVMRVMPEDLFPSVPVITVVAAGFVVMMRRVGKCAPIPVRMLTTPAMYRVLTVGWRERNRIGAQTAKVSLAVMVRAIGVILVMMKKSATDQNPQLNLHQQRICFTATVVNLTLVLSFRPVSVRRLKYIHLNRVRVLLLEWKK